MSSDFKTTTPRHPIIQSQETDRPELRRTRSGPLPRPQMTRLHTLDTTDTGLDSPLASPLVEKSNASPLGAGLQAPQGSNVSRPSLTRKSSVVSTESAAEERDIMNEPTPDLGIHPEAVEAFRADSQKLFRAAKKDGALNMTRRAGQLGVIPFYATTIAAGMTSPVGVIVGPLAGALVLLGIGLFASVFRNMRRSSFLSNSKTANAADDFNEKFAIMKRAVNDIGEENLRADYPAFAQDWAEAKRLNAYLTFDKTPGWKGTLKNVYDGVKDTFKAFGDGHLRFFGGISKAMTGGNDVTEPLRKVGRQFSAAIDAKREAAKRVGDDDSFDNDAVPMETPALSRENLRNYEDSISLQDGKASGKVHVRDIDEESDLVSERDHLEAPPLRRARAEVERLSMEVAQLESKLAEGPLHVDGIISRTFEELDAAKSALEDAKIKVRREEDRFAYDTYSDR